MRYTLTGMTSAARWICRNTRNSADRNCAVALAARAPPHGFVPRSRRSSPARTGIVKERQQFLPLGVRRRHYPPAARAFFAFGEVLRRQLEAERRDALFPIIARKPCIYAPSRVKRSGEGGI